MAQNAVGAAPAHDLASAITRDPFGGLVPVDNAPIQIDEVHTFEKVVEQHPEQFDAEHGVGGQRKHSALARGVGASEMASTMLGQNPKEKRWASCMAI